MGPCHCLCWCGCGISYVCIVADGNHFWSVIRFIIVGNHGMLMGGHNHSCGWSLAFSAIHLWAVLSPLPTLHPPFTTSSIPVPFLSTPVHSCRFLPIFVDSSGMDPFLQESVGHGEVLSPGEIPLGEIPSAPHYMEL